MTGWVRIDPAILTAAHDEQLAEHGGAWGMHDQGLFESAVARPLNLAAYGADNAQCVLAILSVASGAFDEDAVADWIRKHLKPA